MVNFSCTQPPSVIRSHNEPSAHHNERISNASINAFIRGIKHIGQEAKTLKTAPLPQAHFAQQHEDNIVTSFSKLEKYKTDAEDYKTIMATSSYQHSKSKGKKLDMAIKKITNMQLGLKEAHEQTIQKPLNARAHLDTFGRTENPNWQWLRK